MMIRNEMIMTFIGNFLARPCLTDGQEAVYNWLRTCSSTECGAFDIPQMSLLNRAWIWGGHDSWQRGVLDVATGQI